MRLKSATRLRDECNKSIMTVENGAVFDVSPAEFEGLMLDVNLILIEKNLHNAKNEGASDQWLSSTSRGDNIVCSPG